MMQRPTVDICWKILIELAHDMPEDVAQDLLYVAKFVMDTEERRKFDTDAYRVNSNFLKSHIKDMQQQLAAANERIAKLKKAFADACGRLGQDGCPYSHWHDCERMPEGCRECWTLNLLTEAKKNDT